MAGVAHEVVEQLVLDGRQLDRLALHGDFLILKVDRQVASLKIWQSVDWRWQLRSSQRRLDTGHQSQVAEWLDHVIVCAQLESSHLVDVIGAGTEDNDRHVRNLANSLEHL